MRGYDLKNVCLWFWLSERIAFQVNLVNLPGGLTEALCKMENLSISKCVTNVYQAARDGSSDLEDLLIQLKTTEQRKTALETKTKDGSHFVTPLIIAAHT